MKSISINFEIKNFELYLNDVQDIPRAFSPYITIDKEAQDFLFVDCLYVQEKNVFEVNITSSFYESKKSSVEILDNNIQVYKKITKHFIKNMLYKYLREYLGISLPYGSLTGVRPTKLYYELLGSQSTAISTLKCEYGVSEQKIDLLQKVIETQKGIYSLDKRNCDIFVNIPFCPSRCNYCSFISNEVAKVKDYLPEYVGKVRKELKKIDNKIEQDRLNLRSIYVGGGTPTSIGAKQLFDILSPLKDYGVEFTVEAGRPDTITKEILNTLMVCNVNRISINPQTFHNKTLCRIGRNHTVEEFYQAYELAREYNFDINIDLIAGLDGESLEDFCYSINKAIELESENITIHTLSIKRGADIRDRHKDVFGEVSKMVNYAHNILSSNEYAPYYLYRQKNMADNLENTGYCRENKACVYNIDMMEDISIILGAGAGAITKVFNGDKIDRHANSKGLKEYLER